METKNTDERIAKNEHPIVDHDPVLDLKQPEKRKRKSITRRLYTKVWIKLYPGILSGYCKLCRVNEISLTDTSSWEASHIVPFSAGGDETLENLVPLCKNCNRRMGKKTVQEYAMEKYPSDYKKILSDLKIL